MILMCELFGCYDLASILLIVGCNGSMNVFGLLMEKSNYYTPEEEKGWTPFWFGCFAGVFPWIVCQVYFLDRYDLTLVSFDQIPIDF